MSGDLSTLESAGWKPTGNEQYDASLEYKNGKMRLEVSYLDETGSLYVFLQEARGVGREAELVLKCHDDFPRVLDTIVAFQDDVTPSNFRDHVRELVRVCPEAYAVEGEDELVQLTDE